MNAFSLVLGFSFGESLTNLSPVDNSPDFLKIHRSEVFVVQVVGVFPDVNAEDGAHA